MISLTLHTTVSNTLSPDIPFSVLSHRGQYREGSGETRYCNTEDGFLPLCGSGTVSSLVSQPPSLQAPPLLDGNPLLLVGFPLLPIALPLVGLSTGLPLPGVPSGEVLSAFGSVMGTVWVSRRLRLSSLSSWRRSSQTKIINKIPLADPPTCGSCSRLQLSSSSFSRVLTSAVSTAWISCSVASPSPSPVES